jgi:hypothetical protein
MMKENKLSEETKQATIPESVAEQTELAPAVVVTEEPFQCP